MNDPEVLAAMQHRRIDAVKAAEYIRSLPKSVKRRLKALKRLQADVNRVESQFCIAVHELECSYAAQYAPLMKKRHDIVAAVLEPSDDDCDWPSDDEDDYEHALALKLQAEANIKDVVIPIEGEDMEAVKGIPDFWLITLKNVHMMAILIQDHDEPILKHLEDIKLHLKPNSGFMLEFVFSPNEHFTNSSLTKEYVYKFHVDEDNALDYEGPEIEKSIGCTINWKDGKNVTVKEVKKVQAHKKQGTKRTVIKTVKADSFFNFFDPPTAHMKGKDETMDDDAQIQLADDYERGHFLSENVIPKAILYFTGQALEDSDDEDTDFDDTEEDEEEGGYHFDDDDDDDVGDHKGKPNNHTSVVHKASSKY